MLLAMFDEAPPALAMRPTLQPACETHGRSAELARFVGCSACGGSYSGTGGMNTEPLDRPSRVGEYREHAEKLRALAAQTRFVDGRIRLLILAASFELLAGRVEDREIGMAAATE